MRRTSVMFINIGNGKDISIAELARLVADVVGFRGNFAFDHTKPDGTAQKLLDVSRLTALGWHAVTPLQDGIQAAYNAFVQTQYPAPAGHAA